jgi:hemolysin III
VIAEPAGPTAPALASPHRAPSVDDDLPHALADTIADFLDKPRARGWIHLAAAAAAIAAAAVMVPASWVVTSPKAGWATLVYAVAIVAMFSVSATYHRVHWKSPSAMTWMKRVDHSLIFILIAGSYTPFALLAMPSRIGTDVLVLVWTGAAAGVALKMLSPSAPRWVGLPLYLLLGWAGVWFAGILREGAGSVVVTLLVCGGVLYNIGAVCYGLRWPNPWPLTFGYHEFFHAFTAAAAICHYVAVWCVVF